MLQCSIPRVASTNSEGSPIAPAADAFLARGISSLEAPLLKGSALTEAPGVPVRGMAVNLVTGGLGAGILTLPWGMAGASVLTALLLTVLVVVLNGFTIMILVRAAEEHQRFDLGALLALLPGRWLGPVTQGFCNGLVWVVIWMALVGYIIVVQDCMTPLMPAGTMLSQRSTWAVLGSAVVLPLSLTDLKFLSSTSTFSVGVNFYLFALLCVRRRLSDSERRAAAAWCHRLLRRDDVLCYYPNVHPADVSRTAGP